MAILRPFLAIFVPTIRKSFTKLRFRRTFWGPKEVWIMIGTIIMTQKGKETKTQKTQMHFFSTILPKNIYGNICILSHKFWMNQGSDLLSTLKWPSKPQFCERYWYSRQKNDQKWSYTAIYEFSFVSDQSITYRVGRLVISLGSKEGKGANEMSYDFK